MKRKLEEAQKWILGKMGKCEKNMEAGLATVSGHCSEVFHYTVSRNY